MGGEPKDRKRRLTNDRPEEGRLDGTVQVTVPFVEKFDTNMYPAPHEVWIVFQKFI
jgi:hypothetical protein